MRPEYRLLKMNFKIVIALAFSVFCVLLLFKEAEDMGRKDYHRSAVKMYNRTFIESFDFERFDLANETGERLLINELQGYFIDKSNGYTSLFCWPLWQIYPDRNEFALNELAADSIRHLNESFYRQFLLRNETTAQRSLKFFKLFVLDSIRSARYHVYQYQFCVEVDYYFYLNELRSISPSSPVYSFTNQSFNIQKVLPGHNWFQIWNSLDQNMKGNCTERWTRFGCANSCFKEKSKLSKYFYNADEHGSVYLREDPLNSNASLRKHESTCLKRCGLYFCNNHAISYYYNFSSSSTYYDTDVVYSLILTRRYAIIQPFNFKTQFLGLLLSFAGLSLNGRTFSLLKAIVSRLFKNRRVLLVLKVIFTSIWAFILLALSYKILTDYQEKLINPSNT